MKDKIACKTLRMCIETLKEKTFQDIADVVSTLKLTQRKPIVCHAKAVTVEVVVVELGQNQLPIGQNSVSGFGSDKRPGCNHHRP